MWSTFNWKYKNGCISIERKRGMLGKDCYRIQQSRVDGVSQTVIQLQLKYKIWKRLFKKSATIKEVLL